MKKQILKWVGALAATLTLAAPAMAEDIDLFMGSNLTGGAVPNVLIILDNTANWSQTGTDGNTAFSAEKSALVSLFNSLPANKFKVGLMMFSETGSGNSNPDGAYLRAAIRTMNATSKPLYASMINGFDINGDKGNGGKTSKSFYEVYQYLKGLAPYAGNNKNKTDYTGSTYGTTADQNVHALTGNALSSKTSTTYVSPVDSSSCEKTYVIFLSNGAGQDSSNDIEPSKTALQALAGSSYADITLNPSGSQDNVMDEWSRYLKQSSLGVVTYTVDINKVTTGQGPGWTALLKSMANQSSGKYFDINSSGTAVLDTLNTIFSEIQSVNSVFASVSLPISVNTQGTFLNQVYVGMFRPDADSYPRWMGNLKQYKIGTSGTDIKLQDADGVNAINNQTGFITECARSFWTPTTVDTAFTSAPKGDCLTIANSTTSNYPDGNVVEKGAQAYKLRSSTTRTVLTCNNSTCTSMVTFNTSNVGTGDTGAADSATNTNYVNWSKGLDVLDEDIDGTTTAEMRLSAHGDVVHSRPVAVNFGSSGSASVVVYYGGNDGWLRAVNGNRSDAIGSIAAGQELWAFMPGEFQSKIKRLYNNTSTVSFPGSSGGAAKDYGMDGPITAYQGSVGGSNKTILYATMRRGGRSIYAFDVTNATSAPTSPSLKWRIGCSANNDCTTGMTGLGQTWSSVLTFTHPNYSGGNTPLLIFGGGYDTCEDYDSGSANHNCTSSAKGRGVYVVDGNTGDVVQTFATDRPVIADVIVVPDSSGIPIYAYTADLGGNVYRLDLHGASSAWTVTKIASLGCDTTGACTAPRKFQFVPSVVDNGDDTYNLYLGSGDREKPVTSYTASASVANKFFMLVDKPTVAAGTYPGSTYCGSNIICVSSLYEIAVGANPTTTDLATKPQGWMLDMSSTEQVVTSAITIFGVVTFSTHQPATTSSSACSANLGTTRVYNIDWQTGASANGTTNRYEDVAGDGLPPSAVGGQVTLDNGQTVPFCIGCSADSPLEAVKKSGGAITSRPKTRLYWYIEK